MEYNFRDIENNWRKFWAENKTFKVTEDLSKPKYYVLDMFPYPSGAGLHVGHPLGYIASDIYARYKRLQGYNVLHPMGYDSFGLPAEQYAIQTGQHPAITTEENIARYRDQLDKIGFSYDWDREVRTSSPEYYKWTQWIFKQLFDCYYDNTSNKAERISKLVEAFEANGNSLVNAVSDCETIFSAAEWKAFDARKKEEILQEYRLAYLADSWVNWCPALGTVLANDEVVNGVSERGGHPVEQKLMRQWSMRIKAYAERLLTGLETVDWTDSIKDQQRNWIGKSQGCSLFFPLWKENQLIENSSMATEALEGAIEVFTTRPDTVYGVSFMVLAPEHPFVEQITTAEFAEGVANYKKEASLKSERDRQADVKNITGQFTGAYAIHPFNGEKVQIWIGDYVLASYGTGAVMAVPCGDQRDYDFAKHFNLEIKNIFADVDISEAAYTDKDAIIANSDFLNGLDAKTAMKKAIEAIEEKGLGKGKTNYRLRDAVFSRQRYWGEPFPVYFENELPQLVSDDQLPIRLPEVDKYLPTEEGEPPLARATKEAWKEQFQGDRMDYNTMPGWAGSSWYFLRYMDPKNEAEFVSKEKADYWKQVDLYIGGSEHATGHLLYARFWTKFLFDQGYISFDEPFAKMINQGMILGRSSFVNVAYISYFDLDTGKENIDNKIFFYSKNKNIELENNSNLNSLIQKRRLELNSTLKGNIDRSFPVTFIPMRVDISLVDNDILDIKSFKNTYFFNELTKGKEFQFICEEDDTYICEEDGTFICGSEVEKMSKSKYNVQTPDELVEKFGADTLRMYEMFLGPLEQSKPWDTKGINGVHNFLRKLWRLFNIHENGQAHLSTEPAGKDSLKTLHRTIKKMTDDLDRFSFNTGVSNFMICVNELTDQKCSNKQILEELLIMLSPYAPHICEELWVKLGNEAGTINFASFPKFDESHLVEANHAYPVSFNGKMRLKIELPTAFGPKEVEEAVLANADAQKWLEGKAPKKVIVVPGKIVNIVV
jgi:leucyl-tRNA synthetase